MKIVSQREAYLAHWAAKKAPQRPVPVSTAEGCVVPTRAGRECFGALVDGESFCGPHKQTVGRQVTAVLGGLL